LNLSRDKALFCGEHLDVTYGECFLLLTEYYWIIKSGRKGWEGNGHRWRGKVAYRAFGEGT
jgi:hypothetical protein